MSASIYYSFKSKTDLTSEIDELTKSWDAAFDGKPYESWTWYQPKTEGDLINYEGATALPMDADDGPQSVFVATSLLTELRRKIGGEDWSVSLDDMEFPWDDDNGYVPDF